MFKMNASLQSGSFIGFLRGIRRVSGLTLAETQYAPGLRVPAHAHDHALCCLVVDGSFTERVGSRRSLCEPGGLIFQPKDEPHAHEFHASGGRCFNIQFGSPWVERLAACGVEPGKTPIDLQRSRAGWLANHLYQEFHASDSASILAIEGFALALVAEITRTATRPDRGAKPRWLIQAVEHLHAHALEPISLTELAAMLGVDPTHLGRTFRRHHGCTMGEYLRKLRIEAARKDLLTTAKPISAIAVGALFADQAHFSRVFKQLTGLTPAAFRTAATTR